MQWTLNKVFNYMEKNRFMRLIVLFDLPTETKLHLKWYRDFIKYLKSEGFIRLQYSVYSKLCINSDSVHTAERRLIIHAPPQGDIRFLIVTERQFQNISNINGSYSLQEQITTTSLTFMIGGLNDESDI